MFAPSFYWFILLVESVQLLIGWLIILVLALQHLTETTLTYVGYGGFLLFAIDSPSLRLIFSRPTTRFSKIDRQSSAPGDRDSKCMDKFTQAVTCKSRLHILQNKIKVKLQRCCISVYEISRKISNRNIGRCIMFSVRSIRKPQPNQL